MQKHLISIMSIAGSDCSGGAGIQADIRAAAKCGVFASTVVTAVTTQNSHGMSEMIVMSPETVISQMKSIFADSRPMAIKIGMLGSIDVGMAVAKFLKDYCGGIPIVIDPVIKASAGGNLTTEAEAMADFYKSELSPLASIVTPNLNEAKEFGVSDKMQEDIAIELLNTLKCRSVTLKGGHSEGDFITDTLAFHNEKGQVGVLALSASKIECRNLHGTGCTYSSILAAQLAKGSSIEEAFATAFWLMKGLISASSGYTLGDSAYGPLNLFNYHIGASQ